MDGRPQRKVADYLTTSFGVRHLDTITTAGLVKHIAGNGPQTQMIMENLSISLERHGSSQIAVVAHHDCAGNPITDKNQKQQVVAAVQRLQEEHPTAEVVGLWLNENWIVERVTKT